MTCYVTLIGNAGSDCEMRTTSTKVPFVRFSIASSATKDHTDWYSVTAFGELIPQGQKVLKGSRVTVTGKLSVSQGKDGKTYLNVRASDLSVYTKNLQTGYDAVAPRTAGGDSFDDVPF